MVTYRIDWVVHFSALLSAVGEKDVGRALQVGRVLSTAGGGEGGGGGRFSPKHSSCVVSLPHGV